MNQKWKQGESAVKGDYLVRKKDVPCMIIFERKDFDEIIK